MNHALIDTNLTGLKLVKKGKVRDIYDLGEHYLMVATDRISAFRCDYAQSDSGQRVRC